MRKTYKLLSLVVGLVISSGNAIAAETTKAVSSTDVVGNLGFFSSTASTIMMYTKYAAFFIAIVSLLAMWSSGMLAKVSHKIQSAIDSKEGFKKWLVEGVLVVVAFIVLFNWIIPTINGFVPSG